MSKNFEKICLAIIRWGSYLIFFIPLLVYRYTLFPYIFPKIIAFQILVEIIFAVWLFLVISEKKYRPNFKNPVILSLTIFIGILFLTMLTGVDVFRSFWGTTERMTGVLTMFHFYLWFLILVSCFKEWKDWRKFIWVSLGCSFLVGMFGMYGLGQKLGVEFLMKGGVRSGSTLGNPIYLSVYAMLHIFLAGFLAFVEKKLIWRGLALFLVVFNLIVTPLGASRAVLASFGISIILFLIFLIFSLPYKKAKIGAALLLILVVGSGVFLFTQRNEEWIKKSPYFLKRMMSGEYLEEDLWRRTEAWNIAFKGFKERPVFGLGWENYNVVFNKHYNPRYLEYGIEETWWDKSHNQVMDTLSLAGVLGIFSYFAIFFSIFWLLFRKIKKEADLKLKIAIGILGIMFVAYFLQNLFVFDTPAPLIIFYFSLGLVYFITEPTKLRWTDFSFEKSELPEGLINTNIRITNKKTLLIILVIICLPLVIYQFNLKPFWQSKLAFKGANTSLTDLKTGLYFYKKALEQNSFANPEIRLQLLKSVMEGRGKTDQITFQEGLEFTISEMEKSIKKHPLDVRYHLYLGKFYNLASSYDKTYLEKAEETLEKALELSPQRQEVYYDLGLTKMMLKKNNEAIAILEKVVSLNEKVKESHWYLGLALLNAEKYEEGLKKIERAVKMGYSYYSQDPNTILFIAQGYDRVSDYKTAVSLCDFILKNLDPQNLTAMAYKVVYLNKAGQKSEALKLIEEISKIDKALAEELEKIVK